LARVIGSYDDIWNDLNRCVTLPSTGASELHSLQEQMVCHVFYGLIGGGSTFDFEGWRPEVSAAQALNPENACDWRPAQSVVDGYAGDLVHWAGDTSSQHAAWLIVRSGNTLHREYIPTAELYDCLAAHGHAGPFDLAAGFMHIYMTDDSQTPTCATPTPPTSPAPPPPITPSSTWAEQEGNLGVNTFTDPYNASGMGPKIAPSQWVDVSCKVYAPAISSANPDGYWYRIKTSPWNDRYYSPANTFWNGDVPGHTPYTHNTDFNVPNC
jgi:hypothetical protein